MTHPITGEVLFDVGDRVKVVDDVGFEEYGTVTAQKYGMYSGYIHNVVKWDAGGSSTCFDHQLQRAD